MDAKQIIWELEKPSADRRPVMRQIKKSSLVDLLMALQLCQQPLTRQLLCDILGDRHDPAAAKELLIALQDKSSKVRSSAAEALAKIKNPKTGEPLMKRLVEEEDVGVRHMVVLALGSIGYRAAIPIMIRLLSDDDATTRGCAAWSLGELRAYEARDAMVKSLIREIDPYARGRLVESLNKINEINN